MRFRSTALRATLWAGALLTTAGTAAAQDAADTSVPKAARIRLLREYQQPAKVDGQERVRHVKLYFDYDAGVARRTVVDENGAVLEHLKAIAGQPRPTEEEFAEAIEIVRADRIIGGMLARVKAVPDGGFSLVEGEGRACGPGSRCVHILWLSPDRVGLVRWTVVDLVKQAIAYRAYRPPDEAATGQEVAR